MDTTVPALPKVPLGPYQVSRLIIGDNHNLRLLAF